MHLFVLVEWNGGSCGVGLGSNLGEKCVGSSPARIGTTREATCHECQLPVSGSSVEREWIGIKERDRGIDLHGLSST